MLHFVGISNGPYQNELVQGDLKLLAEQLDSQLWGLLPGFHRLVFEDGQVLLTLCIGNVAKVLRQQNFEADVIDVSATALPDNELLYAAKAISRLCKIGTRLTTSGSDALQAALQQCGFVFSNSNEGFKAIYNPAWAKKKQNQSLQPSTCLVIGGGLAGSAVASSLARRGWAVTVLDSGSQPACGASSLPAGLLVPHTSPDDGPLSRLSRAGVRMTLQQARNHLNHGIDWGHTGVLQRSFGVALLNLPPAWAEGHSRASSDWCYPATAKTLAAAGLPSDVKALWHAQAGWVRPAALVRTWLAAPNITWRGDLLISQVTQTDEGWRVCNAAGNKLAQANLVVLAAGYASQALASSAGLAHSNLQSALQPIRGQVTFGVQHDSDLLPPFAVNGNGGLISGVSTPDGPIWLMGAGYERNVEIPHIKAQDHADNLTRLQSLLPSAAVTLGNQFDPQRAQGWAGIRCATPNRLPRVEQLGAFNSGLFVCTGMGSRGLSFATLCGELLAAQLHGEPLPVDRQLAQAMGTIKVTEPAV